ncbi:hypothetical protein [Micromonospora sp. NPDC049359]|uniref:hypothetical protein n=1 Tax=Micromonospora sp. NPDC049359 TaxID=3364270 RepID=UPI0037A7C9AC
MAERSLTSTAAPELLLISHLTQDSLSTVQEYFFAVGEIWKWEFREGLLELPSSQKGPQSSSLRGRPELLVRSISLNSPLEVALTTAATNYAPLAYGMAGLAMLERVVRLIMEWQSHRHDLALSARSMTSQEADEVLRNAANLDAGDPAEAMTPLQPEPRKSVIRISQHQVLRVEHRTEVE